MLQKALSIFSALIGIAAYFCLSTHAGASAYRLDLLYTDNDSAFQIRDKYINYQDTDEIKFSRDTFSIHHYTALTKIYSIELPEDKECVVNRIPSEGVVNTLCLFPYGFCVLSGTCGVYRIKPEHFGTPQYICQKNSSSSEFSEGYMDIGDFSFRFVDVYNLDGVEILIFVTKDKPEYLDRIFNSIQISIDRPRD